ncbi:MAG: bifunctional methylenetetrahydrofolate dehydrogenase/methenyltetrahydrofolate cyclohydrolase FolD [Isosphaeraceae bacterium]
MKPKATARPACPGIPPLTAQILDGKALASKVREDVAARARRFTEANGRPPGLSVVLVGDNAASQVYVRNKETACRNAGIRGEVVPLPSSVSSHKLLETIDRLNEAAHVDGILVQLPLPRQIDETAVLERIRPEKDVDGFHPTNAGLLAVGRPRFVPCTPLGIRELLVAHGVPTSGKHAVVLGRSNIVGKPMALLMLLKQDGGNATVTVAHTGTPDVRAFAREADILIAAIGQPEAVRGDWIKPGAVVIDVGIHKKPDGRLCGDVAREEAMAIASAITPVPGGVGPMTVAMLLANTLLAAEQLAASRT